MKKHNQLIKILYLNDSGRNRNKVASLLKNADNAFGITIINTESENIKTLNNLKPDVVIFDYNLPSFNSQKALDILKQSGLNIPCILIINTQEKEHAINFLKNGVDDYLVNDRLQRLPYAIKNAVGKSHLKKNELKFKERDRNAELERYEITNDLIQRNKTLQQFTFIVSHNLRAPIANILGISNVLRGPVSAKERHQIQKFLFTAVEELDEIVKDLNTILNVKTEITENKETVNFNDLVCDIESCMKHFIEKENIKITADFTLIDKTIIIKSYIHSIFYNLISNSIKYKRPDKKLTINIKSEIVKEKIKISFKDNGTGIDLKQHGDKVFGLYKRFHPNIAGKGMGLFMTKTQVEILGGTIHVKSNPNIETKFTIELPI